MLKTAVTFVLEHPLHSWSNGSRQSLNVPPKVCLGFSLAAAALPTVLNILEVADPWHAGTDRMALSMPYDPD
jgi:hypothetical protein